MNRLFPMLICMTVAVMACGGGDSTGSCKTDNDCKVGLICDGTCKAMECTSSGQCGEGPGGGERTCAPIDPLPLPGMDPAKMYCTARQCSSAKPCADATKECVYGLCIPKAGPVEGAHDVPYVETRDAEPGDLPPEAAVTAQECKPCTTTADCEAPLTCSTAGTGKFCLKPCTSNAECKAGYVCYPTSSAGKQCLPISNDCKKCAYEGCPPGQCCDLVKGTCAPCLKECAQCTYDFECGDGSRCYKKQTSSVGVCVAECPNGSCASGFTCGENPDKIKVCVPGDDTCKVCPDPAKPYQKSDGTCVECLNSMHCQQNPDKKFCDNNVCVKSPCTGGKKTCADGQCHICCEDKDCPNNTGPCVNYVCKGAAGACEAAGIDCSKDPYFPVCCTDTGTPQCCQCQVDSDCDAFGTGCVCSNHQCFDGKTGEVCGIGSTCPATCQDSLECGASPSGTPLECNTASKPGYCYDPAGSCDGVTACCAPGESCFDLLSLLFGGMIPGGGMPGIPGGGGMPGGSGMAYCSCTATGKCAGNLPCTDMGLICMLPLISDLVCSGGSLPSNVPQKMCFDIGQLLGGLGGI